MRADDLTGRRDERRITCVFANTRHFVEQVLIFIFHAGFFELIGEVGQHATGDLEVEHVDVDVEVTFQPEFFNEFLLDAEEMFRNRRHCLSVKTRVAFGAFEHCDDRFRARLRRVA